MMEMKGQRAPFPAMDHHYDVHYRTGFLLVYINLLPMKTMVLVHFFFWVAKTYIKIDKDRFRRPEGA